MNLTSSQVHRMITEAIKRHLPPVQGGGGADATEISEIKRKLVELEDLKKRVEDLEKKQPPSP